MEKRTTADYDRISDNEIISLIKVGDTDALDHLINRYKNTARKLAGNMFMLGSDHDDLIQEAMIGLYMAICDFDCTKEVQFRTFAELCIKRRLYSAVRNSNTKKNQPLNHYISFDAGFDGGGDEDSVLIHKLPDMSVPGPEDYLIDQESAGRIGSSLASRLSGMELQVLELYLQGLDYTAIAAQLEREPKAVDNALCRIKKKLSEVLKNIS